MPTIVHFDLPADDPARARFFYESLFGWKFTHPPGFPDFQLIETSNLDGSPGIGGGIGKRMDPQQRIMAYFGVASIPDSCRKVENLGGKVIVPRIAVPGYGYLAVCLDTEDNSFGLWQEDSSAV